MKRSTTLFAMSLGLVSAGVALLAGCRSAQQIELSAQTQVDDSQITVAVRQQLAADSRLAAARFEVTTREGVVTLRGRVKTAAERVRAVGIARDTAGVRDVEDLVDVASAWNLTFTTH